MPEIDVDKKKFILQYLLNARRSGRQCDSSNNDGAWERKLIVNAASDLYDKTIAICELKSSEE